MGNYINKLLAHDEDCDRKVKAESDGEANSSGSNDAALHTPPGRQQKFAADPRSATAEICRTPIEVQGIPGLTKRMASAIPKYLQRKPYLETDIDVVMPPLTPKKCIDPRSPNSIFPRTPILIENLENCVTPEYDLPKRAAILTSTEKDQFSLLGLDPRSPAADFDRTPILNTRSVKTLRVRSQEDLHRSASYDLDICRPRFSYCETTVPFDVPEIQVLPDLGLCADKCPAADDTDNSNEPDDSRSSLGSSSSASIETISQSEDDITVIRNVQRVSDECDDVWEIFEKDERRHRLETRAEAKCQDDRERAHKDKIKVWRDSLSSEESREIDAAVSDEFDGKRATTRVQKEDIIIIFDDETVIKNSIPSKVITNDIENGRKTDTVGRKKKVAQCENGTATVDRKKLFSPDSKNGSEVQKCRTPLGNRSNNGQKQELPTKSPQHVLRGKAMSVRRYQENTPPHKAGSLKSRINAIQWDPDSTVII